VGVGLPEARKIFHELDTTSTGYVSISLFISRIEDYMKYKPVEVLIFENQQFRLLQLIKKLGKRNLKSFSKVSQSLEIMASDLAQAFATKEEMPASIDEQIEKQRGRVRASAIVSNAEAARELDEKILSNEASPRSARPWAAQAQGKPLTSSANFIIDMWQESLQKQRPEVRDLIDSSIRLTSLLAFSDLGYAKHHLPSKLDLCVARGT